MQVLKKHFWTVVTVHVVVSMLAGCTGGVVTPAAAPERAQQHQKQRRQLWQTCA